jgi:hypothetical protein
MLKGCNNIINICLDIVHKALSISAFTIAYDLGDSKTLGRKCQNGQQPNIECFLLRQNLVLYAISGVEGRQVLGYFSAFSGIVSLGPWF